MNVKKYVGMDVHKETISVAVMNGEGKLVMESIVETKASTILQFVQGPHGDLHVTFEEGTWAAWLYDLLKPHVTELVVVADAEVEEEYQFERRWYGSNPEQLRGLSEWLIEQQVEEVVMESTAQYWKPGSKCDRSQLAVAESAASDRIAFA
jgi:hypothetical protein